MRERDGAAIGALTTDSISLIYRSDDGDLLARGDEARAALLEIAERLFTRRHVSEWWAADPGGSREWWSRAPGQPLRTIFFSGLAGDATRHDFAFAITPEDELIAEVVVFSVGRLSGRPTRELGDSFEPTAAPSEGGLEVQQAAEPA